MSKIEDIEGLGPKTTKPQLNSKADFRTVKLSPTEGFVMSRVDGQSSYAEICNVTGLGAPATLEILRKLKSAGLIHNPGEPPIVPSKETATPLPRKAPTPPPGPVDEASSEPRQRRMTAKPGKTVLERLDDGSTVDPGELIDGPGLDHLTKTRLVRAARRLHKLSPHELLGVPADADRKALKKAYFIASKELHPDRFYGRDVGTFRTLLERLFHAITHAYESLDKPQDKPNG